MTTRDDSLRLDTAIRDAVAFGRLPLTGRFEAAFAAVLDLHKPQPIDGNEPNSSQYCPSCIDDREPFADYPCPTIRAIATSLGVSGEDRPKPTPAPAEWAFGFGPQGTESAWRCRRCREVMRKNQRACPACAYTVFDPIHRPVVTPEGTS